MNTPKNNIYLLRWCFELEAGGKKFGMWQSPGPKGDLHTKAWCQNSGIIYASIERKNLSNSLIKTIARCHKDDFLNFQWINVAKQSRGFIRHQCVGLTMLARHGAVDCYIDGTIRHDIARNLETNFATFGK